MVIHRVASNPVGGKHAPSLNLAAGEDRLTWRTSGVTPEGHESLWDYSSEHGSTIICVYFRHSMSGEFKNTS